MNIWGVGEFRWHRLIPREIARANRTNMTGEFLYGSYLAQFLSARAPEGGVPRRR